MLARRLHGHLWTLGPFLQHRFRPQSPPLSRHWDATLHDPYRGRIRLTGRLSEPPGAGELLVLVHGLGGSSSSHYMIDAARAAEALGMASLRLNLRGADRRGHDYYHAGLTTDLHATLASPSLADYGRVLLLGFSLGGHVALRYATEPSDPRVGAVGAICPPLDLERAARAIDRPNRRLYRLHVLRGLQEIYAQVARRGPVPISVDEAKRIETFAQWDERVVAPRHGFASAEDYWTRTSVGPLLPGASLPTLVVSTRRDPMVCEDAVRPALETAPEVRAVWLERGGHVGFPADADLGLAEGQPPVAQIISWLRAPNRAPGRNVTPGQNVTPV